MARHDAADLAHRLGREAEAVCRRYLSAGRRQGQYWQVGDISNNPGRSMFVRLRDSPKGPAGKWVDSATGNHGDLLDIIRESCGFRDFADVADEARRFLTLPRPEPPKDPGGRSGSPSPPSGDLRYPARRLLTMTQPIDGTLVETYLRYRGITDLRETGALRFHPRCYYRPDDDSPTETWPAMIAAVTDLSGEVTGAHRTWLARDGTAKAPVDTPRKAMGDLIGHAVCFGTADDVMAAGEGIETVLSLRMGLPRMPMATALSSAHLAAVLFPRTLRRLYIIRDNDSAGDHATEGLTGRAQAAGIEAITLSPVLGDMNGDLRTFGLAAFRANLRAQLAPEDVARFMTLPE